MKSTLLETKMKCKAGRSQRVTETASYIRFHKSFCYTQLCGNDKINFFLNYENEEQTNAIVGTSDWEKMWCC